MKLERRFSANAVAGTAAGSSVVVFLSVSAIVFAEVVGLHFASDRLHTSYDIGWLVLGISACIVMYVALAAFRRGAEDEVWDGASLAELNKQFDRPVWSVLLWVFVAATVGYLIFCLGSFTPWGHRHNGFGGMVYFWMSPVTAYGQIRSVLRPKPPAGGGTSIWRGEVLPLTSNHWGER